MLLAMLLLLLLILLLILIQLRVLHPPTPLKGGPQNCRTATANRKRPNGRSDGRDRAPRTAHHNPETPEASCHATSTPKRRDAPRERTASLAPRTPTSPAPMPTAPGTTAGHASTRRSWRSRRIGSRWSAEA